MPLARPSKPSIKLIALVMPTIKTIEIRLPKKSLNISYNHHYNNIIYFDFSQCLKFISKLKGILMYNTYIILKG